MFDANSIRRHITALTRHQDLVYLDNAATSLVPDRIERAMGRYYADIHASVHRSTCPRAEGATQAYESARWVIADLLNARADEVIFTAGATAGVHLVIGALAQQLVQAGDEIMLNPLEHHSNILPWLDLAQRQGARVIWMPLTHDFQIDGELTIRAITARTRVIAVTLASHVIGCYNDDAFELITKRAAQVGALVVGDASQYIGHRPLVHPYHDVDVLICSAHKMMGPTGIGAVKIAERWHHILSPWMRGGGMVQEVAVRDDAAYGHSTWAPMPHLLEAGTPPSAQAYAWADSMTWQQETWMLQDQARYEASLIEHIAHELRQISHIRVVLPLRLSGRATYSHLISFVHERYHAHDVAHMLGERNICVRAGNLCAQPAIAAMGATAVVRASVHAYTTHADIEALCRAMRDIA